MVDWAEIHEDFDRTSVNNNLSVLGWFAGFMFEILSGTNLGSREIYQQKWEKVGLTYQDAREWIPAGFKPEDYWEVKQWKDFNFTSQEAKSWLDVSLNKNDAEFAAYLRYRKHQPSLDLDLKHLREKFTVPQNYLDCFYPKDQRKEIINLDIEGKNFQGNLDLSDFVNLEKLNCSRNRLTSSNLENCSKLEELHCELNKFTDLDLTSCEKLKTLDCDDNNLKDLKLPFQSEQLTKVNIMNNDLSERDLSMFSHLIDLKELNIGSKVIIDSDLSLLLSEELESSLSSYREENRRKISIGGIYNRFKGSLKPLWNLTKLEKLNISDTDIDSGLEYLPKSINKDFECSFKRPEARVSEIWEELQPYNGSLENWREIKWNKKFPLAVSPLTPPQLLGEVKQKEEKQFLENIQDFKYDKIHFDQWGESNFPAPKSLPTRLYNIQTRKIEETYNRTDIKKYVTLSYLWGSSEDFNNKLTEREKNELNNMFGDSNVGYNNVNQMTRSGYKAWKKAIETCCHLETDYLWIDQLCIDQNSAAERNKEVPKMRQYYGNSEATLIAIDEEVEGLTDSTDYLGKIVNSEWFTRSWTFQEGWLSKHTLFMFDDKLIDGWAMTGTWALNQTSYADVGKYNSRGEFDKGSKKIATPLGWTYYRDGYTEEDKVEMTLNQALKEIKHRKRSVPVDGIYSILGLLPYGEEVEVEYKPKICPKCPNQQEKEGGCGHPEENKKWPIYTKEDLKKVFLEVMEVALEEGYAEPIAWHGEGVGWMPKIDENGSLVSKEELR